MSSAIRSLKMKMGLKTYFAIVTVVLASSSILAPIARSATATVYTENNVTGPTAGIIYVNYVNLHNPAATYFFKVEQDDPKEQAMLTELPAQLYLVQALE